MNENMAFTSLGDICDLLSGFSFKSNLFSSDSKDVFLVKGSNVGHHSIDYGAGPWWKVNEPKELEKYELREDDVILAMDRPIVGDRLKFTWIRKGDPKSLLVQRVARLRGSENLDIKYLRYVIGGHEFQAYIDTITTGANIPHISGPDIKKYRFPLPALPTQKKIAGILSAYDDLIENNLKRIKLLEEMAQITYEEWFVRLRFPGHETASIKPETGLPEGWQRKENGDCCEVSGGGTPSRGIPEYWEGGTVKWFSPTDLSKAKSLCLLDSSDKITEYGLKKSSARLMGKHTFMMTSRATIGLFGLIDKEYSTNQGFINVTPLKPDHKYYLLFNFKARVDEFIGHASGATFLEISKSKFKKLKITWPSEGTLSQFHSYCSPIVGEMMNLTRQNEHLREARDILLPRLMTGMIDVEQYDPADLLKAVA